MHKRKLPSFFLVVLCIFSLPACAQVTATSFVHTVKLPYVSNIYPDTFAIYWRPYEGLKVPGTPSIKVRYQTMYGDYLVESDFLTDSICGFTFDEDHKNASTLSLDWTVRVGDQRISNFIQSEKALIVLKKDPEIEALRALVASVFRWQNLKLLADAYERKQCFVNAFYVYAQLVYVDKELGQQLFKDFYARNKLTLDSSVNSGER